MASNLKEGWAAMSTYTKRTILRTAAAELVTLNDAAEITGSYSGMTTYRAAMKGDLFTVTIGKFMYTTVDALQDWYTTKRPHDQETIREKWKQWQQSQ